MKEEKKGRDGRGKAEERSDLLRQGESEVKGGKTIRGGHKN